jgi:hypothetical protein
LKRSNPGKWILNQGCVLVHDLESMLLRDPPQNRFSTVSVISRCTPSLGDVRFAPEKQTLLGVIRMSA